MLGAQGALEDGQQRGELVAGPGRIPRLPGPGGEVAAIGQGVGVLGTGHLLGNGQPRGVLVAGPGRSDEGASLAHPPGGNRKLRVAGDRPGLVGRCGFREPGPALGTAIVHIDPSGNRTVGTTVQTSSVGTRRGHLCVPRISSTALTCKVAFSLVRP